MLSTLKIQSAGHNFVFSTIVIFVLFYAPYQGWPEYPIARVSKFRTD